MASDIYRHAPCWTEEIIVTTHLRIAAGVCALSIGLLVGGSGAVALADGTDVADATGGGTTAGGQDAPSGDGPISTVGNQRVDEEADQGLTKPTDSGADGEGPTSTVQAQTNSTDDGQEGTGGTDPGADDGTTPSSESTPPSESTAPTSESNVAPPASTVPASDASAPAPTVAAAPAAALPTTVTTNVVAPVTNAFVSVAQALGTMPGTFAGLPTSQTPVMDVITSMQNMLNSVAGAGAALVQMPSDVYTLLGIPQSGEPSLIGAGGALDAAARAAEGSPLFGPLASQLPQMPVVAADAPLFGIAVHASNVGGAATTGLNQSLTLSGLAPVPSGVSPATRSFLDNVVNSVLVPASLTALAAIAVPGLGGLMIVCAAGIRIGYRQAKAGLAVRVAGIARFAGPGPLGVVRSGSLITLHPRAPRSDRPRAAHSARANAANATRHLEKVA